MQKHAFVRLTIDHITTNSPAAVSLGFTLVPSFRRHLTFEISVA